MTIKEFIRNNRSELDRCIGLDPHAYDTQREADEEREQWILNDEGLYDWARSEGVDV